MARHTTRLHVSGYRFVLRRMEHAVLFGDARTADTTVSAQRNSLLAGCVAAAVALAACGVVAVVRPSGELGEDPIVMGRDSGALYVRLGDTVHPVLNLASARLITASNTNPRPVSESALRTAKRGALLGIPGAPQAIDPPLSADESAWTVCDTETATTAIIAGAVQPGPDTRPLAANQSVLVTSSGSTTTYLLYGGRRAAVDLADPVVVAALHLDGVAPQQVSVALLSAIPEAPPIAVPQIPDAGGRGPAALTGFPVGTVVRLTRAGAAEYYVVLGGGVQRIGQVAADLIRFSQPHGGREVVAVAPEAIVASPAVDAVPVGTFPDRTMIPSVPLGVLCVTWPAATSGVRFAGTTLWSGGALPLPAGQAPVRLAQSDGDGPAIDEVFVPPGRSAYVRSTGLTEDATPAESRYLVTDAGVRFAVHDTDAVSALGLPGSAAPAPAPWPILAGLPSGPELSRDNALVARDTVGNGSVSVRTTSAP